MALLFCPMKNHTDPRIDAYIAKSADFAQPILEHLRALVHQACPQAEETLKWSAPSFMYGGQILCGMAAFKAHCIFGFWHKGMEAVLAADGHEEKHAMMAFGRVTSLKDLPGEKVLIRYIRQAAKLNESDEPARPRPKSKPKPELPVPDGLAAALKKNKAAAATFKGFSPSCRREYVEWIADAKRDETRQKRIATAVEWLAEGKQRNWKYMNC
jgi:uncharacterized protein YdeI (YjbR/CyaY-like superfamily)